MPVENRAIGLMLCLAIGLVGLAGCGRRSMPPAAVTPTITAEGIQPMQLTVEVSLTTSEPPAPTPTANSEGALSPRQLTPMTAPYTAPPTTWPVPPVEEPFYEDRTGPTNLLASYYNAINRQEYSRAWEYWETPPAPSFEEFAAGFADTTSVLLAVRPPTRLEGAAGSRYASVPALLSATHVDGSRHSFVGCFMARCPNVGGARIEQEWSFHEATVRSAPDSSGNAMLLAQACEPEAETGYDDQTGPVRLLASYYNAINLGEYSRAWAYWENPPNPSYGDFVQGFADTKSVMLVVRPPTRYEGAAGSVYVVIPALLIATHTDGSRHNFLGCFVARQPNTGGPGVEQEWSLFDAAVRRTPGNTSAVTLLEQVCATGW